MSKKPKSWYAWRDAAGQGGICRSWAECAVECNHHPGEKHQGFNTYAEAWAFAHPGAPVPEEHPVSSVSGKPDGPRSKPADALPRASAEAEACAPARMSEPAKAAGLDLTRVSRCAVSERVNLFCGRYGFGHLSEDQRRAVQSVEGKYLLFAVPGSGKTTVMMARAGYMVHACGIPAGQLMTMTFTRASAKEMRERYRRYFPEDDEASVPEFRTIHSFCMGIVIPRLKKAGFTCPRHVVDEDRNDRSKKKKEYTQRVILSALLKKHGIGKYTDEATQDMVQTAFSGIKNRGMTKAEYEPYRLRIDKQEHPLAPLFEDYQQALRELDCMDYDDMLICALNGLRARPQVLNELRSIYRYWSIDEAQDNSRVQNELLELLCGPGGNLFMVGDDDQSIYSFRGAEPGMLLGFGNRPDVQPLIMGTNYRSHADLVATAKAFVERNENRADKQMKAAHSGRGTICIPQSFRSEAGQYDAVDEAAKLCRAHGKRLGVLYQLNASAFPLIVHMHRLGIPFESSRGLSELLHTKIIGSLLRVLRFAACPADLKAYEACRRDLGLFSENEAQKERLAQAHREQPETPILRLLMSGMDEDDRHLREIRRIDEALSKAGGRKPAEALAVLLRGLADRLKAETASERLYLYGVLSVCELYASLPEMLDDLDAMRKREKQKTERSGDDVPEEETDTAVKTGEKPVVTLSTIHSAKGREWERVILIDALDEVFPGDPQPERIGFDPEEAGRVFYVAVTRAIERLDILTVDAYHGNIEPVSRFIPAYAYEADQIVGLPVEKSDEAQNEKTGVLCRLEPGRYYSVRIGPKPGVYTSWSEVEAIKKEVGSIPPELQPRGHDTYEEAWQCVFPDRPLPKPDQKAFADESIRRSMQLSGGAVFNYAMDIPDEVNRGLYGYWQTDSLRALPETRLEQLRDQSQFRWSAARTDYSGRADGYTAAYLAVNFYKLWLPLWRLLEEGRLPADPTILEIGPGPGTATWSLIAFYKKLALGNPEKRFTLNYTAVEKESGFSGLFHAVRAAVLADLPDNLKVSLRLETGVDAFERLRTLTGNGFDLIVESNVLNAQEDFTGRTVSAYLCGLRNGLRREGSAILIEPREKQKPSRFSRFIDYASEGQGLRARGRAAEAAVNVSGIGLFHDAIAANIRYSRSTEHWFSYAIMAREESA